MEQTVQSMLVENAVHNPNEPRHFMRVKPLGKRVIVSRDGQTIAESSNAMLVLEVGREFYDPVIYVPREDVGGWIRQNNRNTHCPLKGDAVYFDLLDQYGAVSARNVAWSYLAPIHQASIINHHIAFDSDAVTIVQIPS